jgi:hypothetical protein
MNVALLSQPQRELRAYLQRVAGDGGTVETPGEASTFVRRLRSAGVLGSTVIAGVAGGVKAGTLYSIIGPDLDVTRGTVKNRVNRAGVLSEVASGVPATDYAGGVLRGTTVEPSAVNFFTGYTFNSERFASSTVSNELSSLNIMYSYVENTTSGVRDRGANLTTGNPYTISGVFKNLPSTRYFKLLGGREGASNFAGVTVNSAGAIVSQTVAGSSRVVNMGNGYFYVECTITPNTNVSHPAFARITTSADASPLGGAVFTGTGESYIVGAFQCEIGSVGTSRIFVSGSTQTRNADVITDDLTLPQTSGIFTATLNNRLITGTRTIATLRGASTTWPVELRNNRFGFRDVVQGADTTAGTHRVSVWWSDSGATYRLYVDGTLIGTEQTGATPISGTIGTFDYGMNNSTNWLNDALSEIAVISGGTPTQAQTLSTL